MAKPRTQLWRSIAAGALGGLAAGFAMNGYQLVISAASKAAAGRRVPDQDKDLSIKTAQAISRLAFNHELTSAETKWAAAAVHYSLGIGLGATYGVLAEKFPISTAGMGTAYGAAIWLGADEIAVPVLGFAHGRAQTSLSAHVNALGSHLVYGVVTSLTRELMLRAVRL